MPKPTIDALRGVGDFATTYQWNMRFAQVPAIGAYPDSNDLNLRVQSVAIPIATNAPIEIALRGHKVRQPGILGYGPNLEFTSVETVDNLIANFLREWREACYQTRTGAQGAKADVSADVEIIRLDRQDVEIWGYKLFGCFLEAYNFGTLQSEASTVLQPSFTLSYDYFEDIQV